MTSPESSYVLFENHSQGRWLWQLSAFSFGLFTSMLFLLFLFLFLHFFPPSLATNGCLKQTSRIISPWYTRVLFYVLPFPLHIVAITPCHYSHLDRDCAPDKSSKPSSLPWKWEGILNWITNWTFSKRVGYTSSGLLSKRTQGFLCVGDGIALISGEFHWFFHLYCRWHPVASQYVVVVCYLSQTKPDTLPLPTLPPSTIVLCQPWTALTYQMKKKKKVQHCDRNICRKCRLCWPHPPLPWTPCVCLFYFHIFRAFVLMLALSHPLSSALPLTSLHSDSNPPCQLCCWHCGRRRYSFIASICQ